MATKSTQPPKATQSLTCVASDCGGRYRHTETETGGDRFECGACGHEIAHDLPPTLSELAKALCGGADAR